MNFTGWMALAGGLLLLMALSSAVIRRLPISTSVIYLVLGIAIGPFGLGWLHLNLRDATPWMERLTEVAVIVALFTGGLRLRLPLRNPAWSAARRLAGPVMLASIGGVAVMTHLAFGLPMWEALLLGAVLAPTDPVLASAVAVNDAEDHDRMRYGLSGEAGLNDGMAFPFVVFALRWREAAAPDTWLQGWFLHRLLWAVPAGLLLGFSLGRGLGHLAIRLRTHTRETAAPSDFLALALIALSYVFAELVGAWGFLAAFAAGIGLRRAEVEVSHATPHPDRPPQEATAADAGDVPLEHPPAEALVGPAPVSAEAMEQPAVAAGVMFTETISLATRWSGCSRSCSWCSWASPSRCIGTHARFRWRSSSSLSSVRPPPGCSSPARPRRRRSDGSWAGSAFAASGACTTWPTPSATAWTATRPPAPPRSRSRWWR